MRQFFTRKHLLITIGIIVLSALLILYGGLPMSMAGVTVAPHMVSDGDAPDGFSDIVLTTSDTVQLAGWYSEPENGAVILLVHGAGDGRGSMRDYAAMLRASGFGVLAINLRGFGDSEGQINRLGWRAADDIGAAVAFLKQQDAVSAIGGLGLSMGGEALLGAAAAYPELRAVVADGATYRSARDYESMPANSAWYRSFSQQVFNAFVRLFSGDSPPESTIVDSVARADGTHFLFIAAATDDDEVAYNTLFHEAAPERSTLWVIPGVGHTGGFVSDPDVYSAQAVGFFNDTLLP